MFIHVTRPSGRSVRVAIGAIAYVDNTIGGAVLHLIGGESLRVTDAREDVEAAIDVATAMHEQSRPAHLTKRSARP